MVYLGDSIMQKGVPATAGSKMLENFIAPFDATVVTRLQENGVPLSGRVALPEFGWGSPGPLPDDAVILCNDVFGGARAQAAAQGLCYIRPTYGTVSRYGLIQTVSSMDQIGAVCKDPAEGLGILAAIAGNDEKDGAMFPERRYTYAKPDALPGITKEEPAYADLYRQVFFILACAELCGNISRYDGIKYGYRALEYKGLDELYTKTRTEAFTLEIKGAAVMGCMFLSQDYYSKYYEKAMKIRRLIKESLRFDEYDVLRLPADSPLPQLAGLPSLTFGDAQLVANVKNEGALLAAWEAAQ